MHARNERGACKCMQDKLGFLSVVASLSCFVVGDQLVGFYSALKMQVGKKDKRAQWL